MKKLMLLSLVVVFLELETSFHLHYNTGELRMRYFQD